MTISTGKKEKEKLSFFILLYQSLNFHSLTSPTKKTTIHVCHQQEPLLFQHAGASILYIGKMATREELTGSFKAQLMVVPREVRSSQVRLA